MAYDIFSKNHNPITPLKKLSIGEREMPPTIIKITITEIRNKIFTVFLSISSLSIVLKITDIEKIKREHPKTNVSKGKELLNIASAAKKDVNNAMDHAKTADISLV